MTKTQAKGKEEEARKAMRDYLGQAQALDEKTARLRALRLAAEAAPGAEAPEPAPKPRKAARAKPAKAPR